MGVFLKQAAQLLVGQMAGSNQKAKFIVKTFRAAYITSAATIAIAWYSAYRNERVEPGTGKFPFPGLGKLTRQFAPDRPETELPHEKEAKRSQRIVGKTGANQSPFLQASPLGVPLTPDAARKLGGLASFEGKPVAAWIVPFLNYAKSHGWKGSLTQGFRTYSEEVSIYNSGIRPAAHPGTSNHGKRNFPGGAVDVEGAEELNRILQTIPGGSLLKWAGAKDPVHFSYPHNGSY